ncbi:MAG: hypothetical protein ABR512_02845 [Desulfopila sp.]
MTNTQPGGDGKPSPPSLFRRWVRLIIAFLLIVLAVYLAPNLEKLPGVGDRIAALRESDIEVGAWYYDDVKKYFEAEKYIREKRGLDYPVD